MSMRLFRNQIPKLADSLIHLLTIENEYVEISLREASEEETPAPSSSRYSSYEDTPDTMFEEFKKDVKAVLYNYIQTEKRIIEEARAHIERTGDGSLYKMKRILAKRENFGLNDEAPGFIVEQLIEALLHSGNVAEIYAPDHVIKSALLPELRDTMGNQRNLQQEVEQRIKHLEQGSVRWEDQYFLVSQRLKEKYQLD
jgi:uncharacterized protein